MSRAEATSPHDPHDPGAAVTAVPFDVIVIAASLGGRQVLEQMLAPLPPDFPVPIVVVQHVDPGSPGYLPQLLQPCTRLAVRHADAGGVLSAGTVHVARPGRHLLLAPHGRFVTSDGPRVSFARPAADLLFGSAAQVYGARALGVVLTGRLHDGAAGAAAIRRAGGVVLVQDPATCRADGMPRATIREKAAHCVLSPDAVATALVALVMVPGMPAVLGLGRRAVA